MTVQTSTAPAQSDITSDAPICALQPPPPSPPVGVSVIIVSPVNDANKVTITLVNEVPISGFQFLVIDSEGAPLPLGGNQLNIVYGFVICAGNVFLFVYL